MSLAGWARAARLRLGAADFGLGTGMNLANLVFVFYMQTLSSFGI